MTFGIENALRHVKAVKLVPTRDVIVRAEPLFFGSWDWMSSHT